MGAGLLLGMGFLTGHWMSALLGTPQDLCAAAGTPRHHSYLIGPDLVLQSPGLQRLRLGQMDSSCRHHSRDKGHTDYRLLV